MEQLQAGCTMELTSFPAPSVVLSSIPLAQEHGSFLQAAAWGVLHPAGSNAFAFLTPPLYSLCLALAVLVFADLDVLKLFFLLMPDSRQGY